MNNIQKVIKKSYLYTHLNAHVVYGNTIKRHMFLTLMIVHYYNVRTIIFKLLYDKQQQPLFSSSPLRNGIAATRWAGGINISLYTAPASK